MVSYAPERIAFIISARVSVVGGFGLLVSLAATFDSLVA